MSQPGRLGRGEGEGDDQAQEDDGCDQHQRPDPVRDQIRREQVERVPGRSEIRPTVAVECVEPAPAVRGPQVDGRVDRHPRDDRSAERGRVVAKCPTSVGRPPGDQQHRAEQEYRVQLRGGTEPDQNAGQNRPLPGPGQDRQAGQRDGEQVPADRRGQEQHRRRRHEHRVPWSAGNSPGGREDGAQRGQPHQDSRDVVEAHALGKHPVGRRNRRGVGVRTGDSPGEVGRRLHHRSGQHRVLQRCVAVGQPAREASLAVQERHVAVAQTGPERPVVPALPPVVVAAGVGQHAEPEHDAGGSERDPDRTPPSPPGGRTPADRPAHRLAGRGDQRIVATGQRDRRAHPAEASRYVVRALPLGSDLWDQPDPGLRGHGYGR